MTDLKSYGPTITITGPGGIVNYEAEVIIAALQAAGVNVMVDNPQPSKDPAAMVAEIYKRLTDDNWAGDEYPNLRGRIEKYAHVVVKHIPWGG